MCPRASTLSCAWRHSIESAVLKRSLAGLALLGVCLAIRAPASVWDSALRRASQDNFGLLDVQGSLWEGQAVLGALDAEAGVMRAVMPVAWKWHAAQLLRAQLKWDFSLAGSVPFGLQAGAQGFSLSTLRLSLPAQFVMARIPNTLARAGWQGDWLINLPALACDWQGRCDGSLSARWQGAASDLFPGRLLGNYRLDVGARQGVLDFRLGTEGGDVRVDGSGQLDAQRQYSFNGFITGDAAFVNRIPNVASQFVQRTDTPGRLRIALQGRLR